jgi:hypothetical protein
MTRNVRGKLHAIYSSWENEKLLRGRPQQPMYYGVLVDDIGEWWGCQHQHASGSQATRCAEEELSRGSGGLGSG